MKPTRWNAKIDALRILGAPAPALAATTAFMLVGAGPERTQAVWLAATI